MSWSGYIPGDLARDPEFMARFVDSFPAKYDHLYSVSDSIPLTVADMDSLRDQAAEEPGTTVNVYLYDEDREIISSA